MNPIYQLFFNAAFVLVVLGAILIFVGDLNGQKLTFSWKSGFKYTPKSSNKPR